MAWWDGMVMTRLRARAWCRSRGLRGHRCVCGIGCIGMCGSFCILLLVEFSTWVDMFGGGGCLNGDYFGRPAGWAGDVNFVADGAAETAAGDGVGWRHKGGGLEYEFSIILLSNGQM